MKIKLNPAPLWHWFVINLKIQKCFKAAKKDLLTFSTSDNNNDDYDNNNNDDKNDNDDDKNDGDEDSLISEPTSKTKKMGFDWIGSHDKINNSWEDVRKKHQSKKNIQPNQKNPKSKMSWNWIHLYGPKIC